MRGILADENIAGHLARLVDHIRASDWLSYWNLLGVTLGLLGDAGLGPGTPDAVVWRTCQREHLILVTANRNHDGPDSLEAVIRTENTPSSLPVLTLSDPKRVYQSAAYVERVVAKLIEYLVDIDRYRGAGRLYLP